MRRALVALFIMLGLGLLAQENKFVITVESELNREVLEGLIKESLTMDQLDVVDLSEYKEQVVVEVQKGISELPEIKIDRVDDFIRYYFEGIKDRDLNHSYNYLTQEYKDNTNGLDAYIKWWNSIESVKVDSVNVIDPYIEAHSKKVRVHLSFVKHDRRVVEDEALFQVVYNKVLGSWQFLKRLQ